MEHSGNFDKVKNWFVMKMWNADQVRNAVKAGWITEFEFEEITGLKYR